MPVAPQPDVAWRSKRRAFEGRARALMSLQTFADGSLRRWLRRTPALALVAIALALIAEGCSKPGLPAMEGALPQILEVKHSSVHLNAVSFNDHGWIAVGDFGVIAVSGEGVDFTTIYADPQKRSLRAAAQDEERRAVVVGDRGVALSTENGIDWRSIDAINTIEDLKSVAYAGDGNWAIVGANGTIFLSSTWNRWHLRPNSEKPLLNAVAFDDKQSIAVGASHSNDGYEDITRATIVLSAASPSEYILLNQGDFNAISVGPLGWAAVGKRGSIATRLRGKDIATWPGGTTFTTNRAGRFPTYKEGTVQDTFQAVAASKESGRMVAVGENGVISDTSDGISWRVRHTHAMSTLLSVAWGSDERWVAVGDGGSLVTQKKSGDLREFETGAGRLIAVDYRQSKWIAVSDSGVSVSSANGSSWNVSNGLSHAGELRALQQYKGNWIAVGSDGIIGSIPGPKFEARTLGSNAPSRPLLALDSDERRVIAAGERGAILVSRDGRNWAEPPRTPRDPVVRLGTLFALSQYRGRWVAVGGKEETVIEGPDDPKLALLGDTVEIPFPRAIEKLKAPISLLLASSDGDNWVRVDLDSSSTLRAIAHDDRGMFVAVGDMGVIFSSNDGEHWRQEQSPTTSNLGSVSNGKGTWYAAGERGVLISSPDGVAWRPVKGIADVNLKAISNDGARWVVVGAGGAVFVSEDGTRWRRGHSGVSEQLDAVVYGKGRWVAVGGEGTVVTSENGTDWYAVSTPTDATLNSVISGSGGWGVIGEDATWLYLEARNGLPTIRDVNIDFRALGSDRVLTQIDAGSLPCDYAEVEFLAQSNTAFVAEGGVPLQSLQRKRQIHLAKTGTTTVEFAADLAGQLLLKPSDRFWYSVRLRCDSALVTFPRFSEAVSMTFRPWYLGIPIWSLFLISWYGFVLTALLALYLVYPVGIFRLRYTLKRLTPFEAKKIPIIDAKVGDLIDAFSLWIVPLLSDRPRVLGSWVEKYADHWANLGFRTLDLVRRRDGYVPLPCKLGDLHAGETVERPDPTLLDRCFKNNIPFLEIVGPGGAGKTMLAVQIARWALERPNPAAVRRLPVIVEEDVTEKDGVLPIVLRKLRAVFGENVDEASAKALLKNGLILLIFDRASERTGETFSYIERLQGRVEAGAVIVTTRTEAHYEGKNVLTLNPLPLSSTSLMLLLSTLLRDLDPTGNISNIEQQFKLASLITSASARGARPGASEQPLTPLIVRLFVERSIRLQAEGRSLDSLPSSVPEAYFDFLRGVNPHDSSKPNFFSDEEMLRAARVLAVACIGDGYVPSEIDSEFARRVLTTAGWYGTDKRDPIERLKLNGVLVQRTLGSRYRLSFALDPVAEYLAADELVERNSGSAAQLKTLLKAVKGKKSAPGFLSALNITIRARQKE